MRSITPVLSFAPELLLRAQPVRAAIFDVDGVLTDGRIYISERGEEVKAVAHHVTAALGGHGAARECCDLLLMAAGRYAALLHGHLTTLDSSA